MASVEQTNHSGRAGPGGDACYMCVYAKQYGAMRSFRKLNFNRQSSLFPSLADRRLPDLYIEGNEGNLGWHM